jgi:cell division inhibitor SepF
MAGAMRKMGVYLGLVEDDDARGGYDRYAARQSDYDHDDRGYDRYAATDHDEPVVDDRYGYGYGSGYAADGYDTDYPADAAAERVPERAPEPEVSLGRRPATPRTLGLAPSATSGTGSSAARLGGAGLGATGGSGIAASAGRGRVSAGLSGGTSGSAGLAMSEPVAVEPAPAPAPAPEPKPLGYRITTVHPASYNEARIIGERFREGMPVIMNVTEMEHADAKRLVDFAIGLTFGLRGSIERVTAKVFLLSPQDVDVTAEDKARIREGGFFSQS